MLERLSFVATYLGLGQCGVSDEDYVPHLNHARPFEVFAILRASPVLGVDCVDDFPSAFENATTTTVVNTAVCVEHLACVEGHVHFRVVHANAGEILAGFVDRKALAIAMERLDACFPDSGGEILDALGSLYQPDVLSAHEAFRSAMRDARLLIER